MQRMLAHQENAMRIEYLKNDETKLKIRLIKY